MVRDLSTQREIFDQVTVASVVLDDPLTAERDIDKGLMRPRAVQTSHLPGNSPRPGSGPFGRDIPPLPQDAEYSRNPAALKEAVAEVRGVLAESERPVIVAGAEIYRFVLQDELRSLVEHMKAPVATTLLGKSVLREDHPLHMGGLRGVGGER